MYTMNLFPKNAIKSIGFGTGGEITIIILEKVHRQRNSKCRGGRGGLLDDIVL